MKKVAFYTLGCKVNQYDTEAMIEIFEAANYQLTGFESYADVYVINTCTVTSLSDRKSRQMIRKAKRTNKNSIIAVVGCYAQVAADEIKKIDGVNLIIGTKDKDKIIDYLKLIELNKNKQINAVQDIMKVKQFEELNISSYKEKTRAFIKIQEGCNQFCSYCIIPYSRGPIRSRNLSEITNEIRTLSEKGFKEVVLTGIHLASYGKDLKNINLIDVIKKVHTIKDIKRIRLGSIEPRFITKDFINEVQGLEKFCNHYHISLQSGSDNVLKRMNRKYTTAEYTEVVKNLKNNFKDVAITTDIMVGFPGETHKDFEDSLRFVNEMKFSHVHVFKYSPRKGTPAANYPGQINSQTKEKRSHEMILIADKIEMEFYTDFISRHMEVLFEQKVKNMKGYYEGLTSNYIKVISSSNTNIEGKLVTVQLKESKKGYIKGSIFQ